MEKLEKALYKPGDEVPEPGYYLVTHTPQHDVPHTVMFAKRGMCFPPCRKCDAVIFTFHSHIFKEAMS